MTGADDMQSVRDSQLPSHPSEAEVTQLLRKAAQQYEECMRIADLADISEQAETSHPRYAWDNPIGLVVTGPSNAELV